MTVCMVEVGVKERERERMGGGKIEGERRGGKVKVESGKVQTRASILVPFA